MKKFLLLACLLSLSAGIVSAKDPQTQKKAPAPQTSSSTKEAGRIGVGFNSQLSNFGLTSLSLRYWLDRKIAIEGILGFSVGDIKGIDLGGKFLGVLKSEQNLNVYGFGLLGIESFDNTGTGGATNETKATVGGGLGTEFFFNGLPNLGFGAEIGLVYNGFSKSLTTFGNLITSVGIHYYL